MSTMREHAGAGAGPAKGRRRSDIALVGVYEISKLLTVPARLESSLAGVLHLLASFLDMRHGLIALLDDDGAPEVVVGSNWSEATARRYFARLPERAIGRIVVTKMPLVIEHMKQDSLFENWDFSEWNESDGEWSFIGVPIKDRGVVIVIVFLLVVGLAPNLGSPALWVALPLAAAALPVVAAGLAEDVTRRV